MHTPHIRLATANDLPVINAIYNYYVINSTCTYQEDPDSLADRQAWFGRHGQEHPVVVAEVGSQIMGWGALSAFHPRSAYRRTVENAVYIDHQQRRHGYGRSLLTELVARARTLGHHTIIALIDSDQSGSLALHVEQGFARAGHLREAGFKFSQWLDVLYLQKIL